MTLRTKINLVLLVASFVGLATIAVITRHLLLENARVEVVQQADIMMEAAQAIRKYTVSEVKPLIEDKMTEEFLPQSVPAYAATQNFRKLHERYPDFSYKEAALNPTNPIDRASDWEADVINQFRNRPEQGELIGERDTPSGRSLFFARAIQIKDPACLACHDTFRTAPRPMLKRYGLDNGFGWKLNEVIGAQIVSVPMSVPIERANRTFTTIMLSLTAILLLVMFVVNVFLSRMVVRRVRTISELADKISSGELTAPEFDEKGVDEISTLAASFNRMRRSVENAMKLLDKG